MPENRPAPPPDGAHARDGGIEYLESLGTDELRELMSYAFYEADTDFETLQRILSVYEGRDKAPPFDAVAAWGRFQQFYSGHEETFPYVEDPDDTWRAGNTGKSVRPQKRRRMLLVRYAAAALVAALVLYVSPASAYLIPAIANLRGGVFWFGRQAAGPQVNAGLRLLHDALAAAGAPGELAPTWLPDEFALTSLSDTKMPDRAVIHAVFANGTREIIFQFVSFSEDQIHSYEADYGVEEELYTRDGVAHHIMYNTGKVNVIWTSGDFECAISGDFSADEAKLMVNSIYQR